MVADEVGDLWQCFQPEHAGRHTSRRFEKFDLRRDFQPEHAGCHTSRRLEEFDLRGYVRPEHAERDTPRRIEELDVRRSVQPEHAEPGTSRRLASCSPIRDRSQRARTSSSDTKSGNSGRSGVGVLSTCMATGSACNSSRGNPPGSADAVSPVRSSSCCPLGIFGIGSGITFTGFFVPYS